MSSPYYNPESDTQVTKDRLPHWHQDGKLCFITWRLGDSLPQGRLREFRVIKEEWLKHHPKPWSDEEMDDYMTHIHDKIDVWLDAGSGSCVLREPDCREKLAMLLHAYDGERLELYGYVIMPNHVHLLIRLFPSHPLADLMRRIKGASAREMNLHLGRKGKLWQREYYDTLVRSERHLTYLENYIRKNPEHLRTHEYSLWFKERGLQSPPLRKPDPQEAEVSPPHSDTQEAEASSPQGG